MKKPNYKKANEELMKLLASVPEPKRTSSENTIIDVTEESLGTVYQFTDHDLTVYQNSSDKYDTDEKTK